MQSSMNPLLAGVYARTEDSLLSSSSLQGSGSLWCAEKALAGEGDLEKDRAQMGKGTRLHAWCE